MVAFDSNMLVAICTLKVDVFSEVRKMLGRAEFIIPEQVVDEIDRLTAQGKKMASACKIALEAAQKANAHTVKVNARNADEALLRLAETGAVIATNDRNLRRRVKSVGGKTLFVRQGRFLEMW